MPTKYPPFRIVIKYFLLQLPGIILLVALLWWARQWFKVPDYWLWLPLLIWVGKDVVLFPFLWRYYDSKQIPDHFEMVGRQGTALNDLNPEGYVRINGERWKAVTKGRHTTVLAGNKIQVVGIHGLQLVVQLDSINAEEGN